MKSIRKFHGPRHVGSRCAGMGAINRGSGTRKALSMEPEHGQADAVHDADDHGPHGACAGGQVTGAAS